MSNSKKYLDIVVKALYNETKVRNKSLYIPFKPHEWLISHLHQMNLSHTRDGYIHASSYFKEYCREMYGLTEKEIPYVWAHYIKKIYNTWEVSHMLRS